MRSLPNVRSYLEKTGQLYLLEDDQYNFVFKQPLATPKIKKVLLSTESTPQAKTPSTPKSAKVVSRKRPVNVIEEGPVKSSSTTKGVVSPKKVKGRKKTSLSPKKDLPQLRLDAFISRIKLPKLAKESKFKSSFKSVLRQSFSSKKEDGIKTEDAESEEQEGDTEEDAEGGSASEEVYLAEEQEDLYKSEEDEEITDSLPAERQQQDPEDEEVTTEEKDEDIQSEECPSEASTIYELKSEESDSSLSRSRKHKHNTPSSLQTTDTVSGKAQLTGTHRKSASKRSLSPSDSDVSVHKTVKRWKDADTEEESSRSVEMCSDVSTPVQEEDENQNMASKVQTMHLSDSSSSRDIRDSASTSSSNSGSLALRALTLSPSSRRSKVKAARRSAGGQVGRRRLPEQPSVSEAAVAAGSRQEGMTITISSSRLLCVCVCGCVCVCVCVCA